MPIHSAASRPMPSGPLSPVPRNISSLTCEPRLSPNSRNRGLLSAGIAISLFTIPFTRIRV